VLSALFDAADVAATARSFVAMFSKRDLAVDRVPDAR
jgi:hypothetical protein